MKKIALISTSLPPAQSGQSTVLFHLLKKIDPRIYCLITQKNVQQYTLRANNLPHLSANCHFLQPDYTIISYLTQAAIKIKSTALLKCILKLRTYQIKKILEKEECDSIIVCTGNLFDPPAAFNAAMELGLPYILYTFDYYSLQWTDPFLRFFATRYEPDLVRSATTVIVPNECMGEEYTKRYGITPTVIHNPVDLTEYEKQVQHFCGNRSNYPNEKSFVYTGSFYEAQLDAFQNLMTAVQSLDMPKLKIHIYTQQAKHPLFENSLNGQLVVHEAQPITAMPAIQRCADILFLPLSFRSKFPEVIKTSAPGKIGEYLASNRPILVHAPEDSFVSSYFRKYNCGLVVDQDDPLLLSQAIKRLIEDTQLQQTLSKNAYIRSKEDFDLPLAQKKFLNILELE